MSDNSKNGGRSPSKCKVVVPQKYPADDWWAPRAGMVRHRSAEGNAWRIDGRAAEAIVTSTHRQPDPVAGGYGDARWPDLYIQFDGLARRQWPQLVVRVIRLVRQAASGVELAV